MGETRRRRGTGSIRQEGSGWALRIGRGRTGVYVSGFDSRDAAEQAAQAIAGQRSFARLMRTVARGAVPAADPSDSFSWAAARWADMNPRERQAIVFARFRGCCSYCGIAVTIPTRREVGRQDRAVMDHRIAVAGGGPDSFENVVLACQACNAKKADGRPPGDAP
jgi:hypothetical protein